MCLCVCDHLISDTTRFCHSDKLWLEEDVKCQNYKDFVTKKREDMAVLMGHTELCHLELLMSKEKYFTLKLTKTTCTCITNPAEASSKFCIEIHLHKDGRNLPQNHSNFHP